MSQNYVIVGTGVAGVAAAESIHRQDPSGNILLIGNEPHNFYSRPGLAYYLTGELPEKQLFLPQTQPFRTIQARVTAVDPHNRRVTLDNGQQLPFDKLLLATGSQAVQLALPGADLEGVVKLDNLDDARRILKLCKRAKRAIVVGGGITALELAEGLRARNVKTTYLLRSNRYWRSVLDETEAQIVEERLRHDGVQLRHNCQLAQIIGKKGKVAAVETTTGEQFKADIVAIAVGVRPNLELAKSLELKIDRGILVDEYLQTSIPNIFAAGDVAQVFDPFSGQAVLDTLWPTARAQGATAGLNMAGARHPYKKEVALNVTRLTGLTTAIIGAAGQNIADDDIVGIVRGESEAWQQLPDSIVAQSHFEINRIRLMLGRKRLRGALVMGDQKLTHPLHQLIAHQTDITS
ncbi:MAG: NAD(P)/FAD-dependent oxidoreductase, partial [Chloroflexi bacterium]